MLAARSGMLFTTSDFSLAPTLEEATVGGKTGAKIAEPHAARARPEGPEVALKGLKSCARAVSAAGGRRGYGAGRCAP